MTGWRSEYDPYMLVNRVYQGDCVLCRWVGQEHRRWEDAVTEIDRHRSTDQHQASVKG